MTGKFITFEGPDGAGKTSVLKIVSEKLENLIREQIIITREPGGNKISEEIRKIILDVNNDEMDPRTEALLYAAARRQHIVEKISPALNEDKIVLCDRFVDSSIAYQGAGRKIGVSEVEQMNLFATDGLSPDLTLYLDVPSEIGLSRIVKNRKEQYDRLDREKLKFHQSVRTAYLKLADENKQRIDIIDATKSIDEVVNDCLKAILKIITI